MLILLRRSHCRSPVTWAAKPNPIPFDSIYVCRPHNCALKHFSDASQEINVMLDTSEGVDGGQFNFAVAGNRLSGAVADVESVPDLQMLAAGSLMAS